MRFQYIPLTAALIKHQEAGANLGTVVFVNDGFLSV
jgi:hypothetical protein